MGSEQAPSRDPVLRQNHSQQDARQHSQQTRHKRQRKQPQSGHWEFQSPLAIYIHHLGSWLHEASNQVAVALGAVLVGASCVWDGPTIWHTLFVSLFALTAAGITCYEAHAHSLGPNLPSLALLMVQAAAAAGLAAHVGFEGFQVLFGAGVGFACAYGSPGDWARRLDDSYPGVALLWYQTGAFLGFLVYTVYRKPALAMLAPLLGGLLLVSGLGSLVGRLVPMVWLPPARAPWLHATEALLGEAGAGVLAVHSGLALLGAVVYGYSQRRWAAVACPVGSIGVAALVASTGLGCKALPSAVECPPWLEPLEHWQWTACGCGLWALLAALSSWYQIGKLGCWRPQGLWWNARDTVGQRSNNCQGEEETPCASTRTYALINNDERDQSRASLLNSSNRLTSQRSLRSAAGAAPDASTASYSPFHGEAQRLGH